MKILSGGIYVCMFVGLLSPLCAQAREQKVQFAYKEIVGTKYGRLLVFNLNPLNWMFGVSCRWTVDKSAEEIVWGTEQYKLEANFGKTWEAIPTRDNPVPFHRIQLYYHVESEPRSTVAFSTSALAKAVLEACAQRKLTSTNLRVRYKLETKLVLSGEGRFEKGPELESDWISIEVRGGIVYLIGSWELGDFRGYSSNAGRDDDHEAVVAPPLVLD